MRSQINYYFIEALLERFKHGKNIKITEDSVFRIDLRITGSRSEEFLQNAMLYSIEKVRGFWLMGLSNIDISSIKYLYNFVSNSSPYNFKELQIDGGYDIPFDTYK